MKICIKCGYQNSDEHKYCSNCGSILETSSPSESIICKKCGAKNNSDSNFCLNCGEKLNAGHDSTVHRQKTAKKDRAHKQGTHKQKNTPGKSTKSRKSGLTQKTKTIWIIPAIIIGSIVIAASFDLIFHKYPSGEPSFTESKLKNPVLEAEVYSTASKFTCACGKCEEPLNECNCNTAVEERNFIRSYFKQDKSRKQIVLAVKNRFGGFDAGTTLN